LSKIVADTSVIINGELIAQIESGSIRNSQIIIPQAVLDELQSQASNEKEQGFIGLEKIRKPIVSQCMAGPHLEKHAFLLVYILYSID